MAKLKPEFERRNVKIIGLSVDPVENHKKWAADIEETQGAAPNYPTKKRKKPIPWAGRCHGLTFGSCHSRVEQELLASWFELQAERERQ
jgi:hypothetical protein